MTGAEEARENRDNEEKEEEEIKMEEREGGRKSNFGIYALN